MRLFKFFFLASMLTTLFGCVGYVPMNGPSAGAIQVVGRNGAVGFSWSNPGVAQRVVMGGAAANAATYACDNGWRPYNTNGQAACLDGGGNLHPARVVSQGGGSYSSGQSVNAGSVPMVNGRCPTGMVPAPRIPGQQIPGCW